MHRLDAVVEKNFLLNHPFYQRWMDGTLEMSELKRYVANYNPHVRAFPTYVSGVHFNCDDIPTRQMLLDNLIEEEHGEENHPELWLRFGESLGMTRDEIVAYTTVPEAQELIETFRTLVKQSFAAGIGALYAYESQVPRVAEQKIKGLKENYGIDDARGLKFFEVHLGADEFHSQAEKDVFDSLSSEEQEEALAAAEVASNMLWRFLSALDRDAGIAQAA